MSMSFFPKNLKLMSSVGADERDAPAISLDFSCGLAECDEFGVG
jgi:hypothetical protein